MSDANASPTQITHTGEAYATPGWGVARNYLRGLGLRLRMLRGLGIRHSGGNAAHPELEPTHLPTPTTNKKNTTKTKQNRAGLALGGPGCTVRAPQNKDYLKPIPEGPTLWGTKTCHGRGTEYQEGPGEAKSFMAIPWP